MKVVKTICKKDILVNICKNEDESWKWEAFKLDKNESKLLKEKDGFSEERAVVKDAEKWMETR